MTGFTVAHGTVADMTSPTSVPAHLLALDKPATPDASGDSALRSAIVSVARHYLQLARTRTPAEMESLIWQASSVDGADHGQSCAAFASLTLALGAKAAGQQSWVTGGGSYPWPLHQWADVRVQPNPASPDVVSMLADAQAHHRWHPLGDGYRPRPGDWVLFDGHVEVVARYSGGPLYTVGADSLPGLTVNAHKFPALFGGQEQVLEGALPLLPALIVISQHTIKLGQAGRVKFLDCISDQAVQLLAAFQEQTLVRHFLRQCMFEKTGVFWE